MKGTAKGVRMLSSFKLPEALEWLARETDREWTDSMLFDLCARRGIPLHAAPPIDAQCVIVEADPDAPAGVRVAMRLGWRKAILYPIHVGQLWQVGETEPAPVWELMHDADAPRWAVFDPPVRVTREHLAIYRETLERIAHAWRNPSRVEAKWRGEPQDATQPRLPAVHDAAAWATPAELLEAFSYWLKAEWFRSMADRKWLRDARKREGKPGRSGYAPLFCPHAVMLGLMNSVRGKRLPQVRGWHILRKRFPAAFEAHRHEAPGTQADE